MWLQKQIRLTPRQRGFHLVTAEILQQVPEIQQLQAGTAHFFLQHTSASLGINENADTSVRSDMESYLNELVPENAPYFEHTYEGPDDMPAHIKAALIGNEVTVPVRQGKLALGTWQGLYLGEHRNSAGVREILVTLNGDTKPS